MFIEALLTLIIYKSVFPKLSPVHPAQLGLEEQRRKKTESVHSEEAAIVGCCQNCAPNSIHLECRLSLLALQKVKGHCEFLENWHVSCSHPHGTGLVNILGGKQQHLTEDNTKILSHVLS